MPKKSNFFCNAVVVAGMESANILGASAGAYINKHPIITSAGTSGVGFGIGASLVVAGLELFFSPPRRKPTYTEVAGILSMMNVVGTCIAWGCTKFFIDATASSAPIMDTVVGLPVCVVGLLLAAYLWKYFNELPNSNLDNEPGSKKMN